MSVSFYNDLKKSVSLLVIDDDPCQLDYYDEMISGHPLYSVKKASCARDAEQIIKSSPVIHLCILDFGIDDIGNDEYYLLKKNSTKMPIIIISGSADLERAFEASKFGAAGLIAKPPQITAPKFWDILSKAFLESTILPVLPLTANPLLIECRKIICKDTPESVSDWAAKAHISDAYLRKLWTEI